MDCSLPSSFVHGILQARILEWVAFSSSRGSSCPRDRTLIFCVGRWASPGLASGFFEPLEKPQLHAYHCVNIGTWYMRLNGHEFEQALGVGDGQGSLVCGSLCGCKELDTTEPLNCFSFYVIVHWFVSQFKPTLLTPILVNILFWLLKYIWKYSGNFNSFHLILFFYDFYLFIGIHH